MNTPAHLVMGIAAFGRPEVRHTTLAAIFGAFAPDFSLYLMTAVSIFWLGIDAQVVFGQLYYSDAWQQVFAIDNSFIFWGMGLGLALRARSQVWTAFAGAGLLHLAFDFPLHTHDARMHFWPLTAWKFISPISYWDGAAGADAVGLAALALVLVLGALIFRRYKTWRVRLFASILVAFEAASSGVWRLFF